MHCSRLTLLTESMRVLEELEVGQSSSSLSQPLEVARHRQLGDALCGSYSPDGASKELEVAFPSPLPLNYNSGLNNQSAKVSKEDIERRAIANGLLKRTMNFDGVLGYVLLVSSVCLGIMLSYWLWAF